mgnify:FL=1
MEYAYKLSDPPVCSLNPVSPITNAEKNYDLLRLVADIWSTFDIIDVLGDQKIFIADNIRRS